MDTNIRYHIINNFKGDNFSTLKNAIEESIKEQDELTLPGLGVFFELVWENADQELKNQIIEIIRKRVRKGLDSKWSNPFYFFTYPFLFSFT